MRLVAYQTVWLKANYPVEYLAALLTSAKDRNDKMPFYLTETRDHERQGPASERQRQLDWTSPPGATRSCSACRRSATWARRWPSV